MCDVTEKSGNCSVRMEDSEEDKMPHKQEDETEERSEDQEETAEENVSQEENEDTGREEDEKVAKLYCGGHRGAGDCSVMMEEKMPQREEKDQENIAEASVDFENEENMVEGDETGPKDGKVGDEKGGKEEPNEKEGRENWEISGKEEMDTMEETKEEEKEEEEEERKDDKKKKEEEEGRRLVILLGETELSSFTSCSVASSGTLITVSAKADGGGGGNGGDGFGSKEEEEEEAGRPNERDTHTLLAG